MDEKEAFVEILKEYMMTKNCLEKEKNLFFMRYLIGKIEGIEHCMFKLGYGFYFENDKWVIKRKVS